MKEENRFMIIVIQNGAKGKKTYLLLDQPKLSHRQEDPLLRAAIYTKFKVLESGLNYNNELVLVILLIFSLHKIALSFSLFYKRWRYNIQMVC